MQLLMKFATCIDMKRAAEAREKATAGAAAQEAPKGDGMNEECIGRVSRSEARFVTQDAAIAYANATTDPTDQFNTGSAVPLLFPVVPYMDVVGQAVLDKDLNANLLRLVHGEQDMRFHRFVQPGDLVAPRAIIHSIEKKSSGELLKVQQNLMIDGEIACETISGYFIRAKKKEGEGGSSKPKPPREDPPGAAPTH